HDSRHVSGFRFQFRFVCAPGPGNRRSIPATTWNEVENRRQRFHSSFEFWRIRQFAARTASGGAREAVDQGEDSRLGTSSKPQHECRVISLLVRSEWPALRKSGARELAWETFDRLPFAVRSKRFSA